MPQLTARYRTNRWRPYGQYQFSEANRNQWEEFWRASDGDLQEVMKYAEAVKMKDPLNFAAALHRFLFWVWPGTSFEKTAQAKPKSFAAYLQKIAEEHAAEPNDKHWYFKLGCTPSEYVRVLRLEGVDDADEEYLVTYVNARVPDLGFKLYESYHLLILPQAKATMQEVHENLRKVASELRQILAA